MQEIWLKYSEEYSISNYGKVKNNKTEKVLNPRLNSKGYLRVRLFGKEVFVHRMVAECFLPPSTKEFINHINGNKKDNRLSNLEYCTASENMLHYYRVLKPLLSQGA